MKNNIIKPPNDFETVEMLVIGNETYNEPESQVMQKSEEKTFLENTLVEKNYENHPNYELLKGLIYCLFSAIFFSLCAVIVKYLDDIHTVELAIIRFLGIFLLPLPQIAYKRINPFGPREVRKLLIIRGASGGLSILLRFYCIHYLPIAEATVIIFSFPIVVTILAKIFINVSYI